MAATSTQKSLLSSEFVHPQWLHTCVVLFLPTMAIVMLSRQNWCQNIRSTWCHEDAHTCPAEAPTAPVIRLGWTSLHMAASSGHMEVVQFLAERWPQLVHTRQGRAVGGWLQHAAVWEFGTVVDAFESFDHVQISFAIDCKVLVAVSWLTNHLAKNQLPNFVSSTCNILQHNAKKNLL